MLACAHSILSRAPPLGRPYNTKLYFKLTTRKVKVDMLIQ